MIICYYKNLIFEGVSIFSIHNIPHLYVLLYIQFLFINGNGSSVPVIYQIEYIAVVPFANELGFVWKNIMRKHMFLSSLKFQSRIGSRGDKQRLTTEVHLHEEKLLNFEISKIKRQNWKTYCTKEIRCEIPHSLKVIEICERMKFTEVERYW